MTSPDFCVTWVLEEVGHYSSSSGRVRRFPKCELKRVSYTSTNAAAKSF
jgi:hypothetical protein